MFWVGLIIVIAIIAACLDSSSGKFVIGAAVVAIGLLLLSWITGLELFITLAKVCAIAIVIVIVGLIVISVIDA